MDTSSGSQITPTKKRFFTSRDSNSALAAAAGGGGKKRLFLTSSESSPLSVSQSPTPLDVSPIQRKAHRTYAFREKDSLCDSGLDDSASEADLATPPRIPKNWAAASKASFKGRQGSPQFSTSTPIRGNSQPKQKPVQNLWQAALEDNPELKAFVEKFNAELEEIDQMELDVVDEKGNPVKLSQPKKKN